MGIVISENGRQMLEEFVGSSRILTAISNGEVQVPTPTPQGPTIEEMQTQILLNTEYLVVMSELTSL